MDWAKAKTILIVILLMLNVFLLYTIINVNKDNRATDYNNFAIEYLKSRNIRLGTKISDAPGTVGRIEYETRDFDLNKISQSVFKNNVSPITTGDSIIYTYNGKKIEFTEHELILKDRVNAGDDLLNDPESFLQMVYKYIADLGFSREEISLMYQNQTDTVTEAGFMLKNKDALLFDHIIRASLDKDGVLYMSLPNKKVKRYKAPTEIISAYQMLVMAGLPEGSVVNSVDFGYRQLDEGDFYDTPVWRVILENHEQPIFYNACTGEILKE